VVPLVAHGWIVRQRGRRRVHLSTPLAPSLSFAACKFPSEGRLKKQYADSLRDGVVIVMTVDAAGSNLTQRVLVPPAKGLLPKSRPEMPPPTKPVRCAMGRPNS
jgi:hypothetical protein